MGHVCFTPESGHVQCINPCLLRANSGHSETVDLSERSLIVAIQPAQMDFYSVQWHVRRHTQNIGRYAIQQMKRPEGRFAKAPLAPRNLGKAAPNVYRLVESSGVFRTLPKTPHDTTQ